MHASLSIATKVAVRNVLPSMRAIVRVKYATPDPATWYKIDCANCTNGLMAVFHIEDC